MKHGIYYDMPAATYFADPCDEPSLTQSICKILLDQSPAHARLAHPKLNPDWRPDEADYDKAKAIGNAAHKIVLGRGKDIIIVVIPRRETVGKKVIKYDDDLVDAEDFRTADAQEARDAIAAAGRVPILRKHHTVAKELAAAIRNELDANGCPEAFKEWGEPPVGRAEVVMIARDPKSGVVLRSMADWMVSPVLLYDLKTGATSANPDAIPYRLDDQEWPIQAAMQERILDILFPDSAGRRRFRFVPVEQLKPYALSVQELPESTMTHGRDKLQYAIDRWKYCIDHCEWPAYPRGIHRPEYPDYAKRQWMERRVIEASREPFDPRVVLAG